jgi:hypothetical protein
VASTSRARSRTRPRAARTSSPTCSGSLPKHAPLDAAIQSRFVDGFAKRLQHKNPADYRERAVLEAEVKAQEARVRNVTAAIARSGFSEALAEQLGLEEETLRSLRQRLAAKTPAGERAAVPDPDAVARFLEKVLEIAETAPKRAGVSLSRILAPITLVPVKDPDGTRRCEARGALNTNPAALVAQGGRGSVYGSCGGAHWSCYSTWARRSPDERRERELTEPGTRSS